MEISFYDLSITSYLQSLNAVSNFLKKGAEYSSQSDLGLDELLETRLHPDMHPLRFQLISIAHHSAGAVKGMQRGEFNPPPRMPDASYADFQQLIDDAILELEAYSRDSIDALQGKPMKFKAGDFEIPFNTENFLLSFSLPNFYFHATTAYDILRMSGVPLGKRDYLGQMRTG